MYRVAFLVRKSDQRGNFNPLYQNNSNNSSKIIFINQPNTTAAFNPNPLIPSNIYVTKHFVFLVGCSRAVIFKDI